MTTATDDTVSTGRSISGARAGILVRLCATLALASVGAHLWMAWGHRTIPWESVLMLLMAAVCLPCAVTVWHRGYGRAVRLIFSMSLAMVAVHTAPLLWPGSMAGSHHGAMGSMTQNVGSHPQPAAMLGMVFLELAVAFLAAWSMRGSRECAA
ncbi:hypothetical protein [Arthrobacter alpinus]|uniref:hypothetical protein n=1 Tax=Arthrobacter alpinus TaxID=656366 RepID=UPI00138F63F7|nr:hypothetical protein [Arthrobacter alpinus]